MTAPAGYKQVFSDDFNTLSISANRTADANWYSGQPWGGGFGEAKFVKANSPDTPFSIVDQGGESALRIHMTRDSNGQLQSGLISNTFPDGTSTTPHDGNPYGYYEARMWLPTGKGIWPGFWSLESERLSPNRDHVVEVDVMENYGTAIPTQYTSVVHDWDWKGTTLEGHSSQYARATPGAGVVSSGWHTYGVEITPTTTTFYFDDHAYWSLATPKDLNTDPMFMIDLAAGGGWTVDPNLKDASLYVDYFRAYELQSPPPAEPQKPVEAPKPVVVPSVALTSLGAITNKAAQTLTGTAGTADAGRTVSVLDGDKTVGTAVVKADGSFSLKVTLAGEGNHTLKAVLTNDKGAAGTSAAVTYRYDTVAPDAPVLDLTDAAGKATSTSIAGGQTEAGATVTLYDGKAVIATVTADAVTGAYSFGSLPTLLAGTHVLTARATDVAGNLGKASSTQTVAVAADGTVSSMTLVHADGTKDVYRGAITGRDYTTEHLGYNAAGTLVDTARMTADGVLTYRSSLDTATGAKTTDTYSTAGALTSHAVAQADGSSDTITFGPDGAVTKTIQYVDRSKDIYKTGINGQKYIAEHSAIATNGSVLYSDQTNIDLSHIQTANKSGVILTSTATVSDTFKSAGGDTFTFAAGFGKDTVTGFHAEAGPAHDMLVLDHAQVANFADLRDHHITAMGKDTLITLSPTDSILMKGVQVSMLTADDFKFQDHGLFHA